MLKNNVDSVCIYSINPLHVFNGPFAALLAQCAYPKGGLQCVLIIKSIFLPLNRQIDHKILQLVMILHDSYKYIGILLLGSGKITEDH